MDETQVLIYPTTQDEEQEEYAQSSDLDFHYYVSETMMHNSHTPFLNSDERIKYDRFFTTQYTNFVHIADGGMGAVYRAKDIFLNRFVIVKKLNKTHQKDDDHRVRFIDESRFSACMNYSSIIPVFDLGKDEQGDWLLAMKYVNGITVREMIIILKQKYKNFHVHQKDEHVTLFERLNFFLKCCDAVSYCHSCGVIHGDLKPENLLLTYYANCYLCDFGCVTPVGTRWETPCGTRFYLAPEFLKEPVTTEKLDIYALGLILFETVYLRRAGNGVKFQGLDFDLEKEYVDINNDKNFRHIDPKIYVSRRLKAIIKKATHPDPSLRYASTEAMASDIREFMRNRTVSAIKMHWWDYGELWFIRHQKRMLIAFTLASIFIISFISLSSFKIISSIKDKKEINMVKVGRTEKLFKIARQIDIGFQKNHNRLDLLINSLSLAYLRHKSDNKKDNKYYFYKDFSSLDKCPKDFGFNPHFDGMVSLSNPITMRMGYAPNRYPPPQVFANFCQQIFYHPNDIYTFFEKKYKVNEELSFSHLNLEWKDGTCYSFPGRALSPKDIKEENDKFATIQKRIVANDSTLRSEYKDGRFSAPYHERGQWVREYYRFIYDYNTKKPIGILTVFFPREKHFKKLLDFSILHSNCELLVIGPSKIIVSFYQGKSFLVNEHLYSRTTITKEQVLDFYQECINEKTRSKAWYKSGYFINSQYLECFDGFYLISIVKDSAKIRKKVLETK